MTDKSPLKLPRLCSKRRHSLVEAYPASKEKPLVKARLKTKMDLSEHQLMADINDLDEVLNKKMIFIDKYLFSTEFNPKLVQCIAEQLRRNKGAFDSECFGNLLQTEQASDDGFESQSAYRQIRVLGKHNLAQYYKSKSETIQPANIQSTTNVSNKTMGHSFNHKDLQRFLKKQANAVSFWVPPASYPQFYGYLVHTGKVKQLSSKKTVIRIQRMYIPKYNNPQKLFPAVIKYLQKKTGSKVDWLEMYCSKEAYQHGYRKWGWVLRGLKDNYYRIWYQKPSEPDD